ncbi:GtrA family protein [Glycocaulis profundi]|nr:GtrA family protein [Glycocaulis profundi]
MTRSVKRARGAAERRTFARFAAVGALGFAIDAGTTALLIWSDLAGPLGARACAFVLAVAATFVLHRVWTFRRRTRPQSRFARFLAAQAAGIALNYLVYAAMIGQLPTNPATAAVSVAAGSGAALGLNYLLARLWVFSTRR